MIEIRKIIVFVFGLLFPLLYAQDVYMRDVNDKRQRSILFVINGELYKSKETYTIEQIKEKEDSIELVVQHIIDNELPDLKDYGIKETKIFREFPDGLPPIIMPLVVINTEIPYYTTKYFSGMYIGKQSGKAYDLQLNTDSTYIFSRQFRNKVGKIKGRWNTSKEKLLLYTDSVLSDLSPDADTISIVINSRPWKKGLSLPQNAWGNKRRVTLKRPKRKE